MARRKIVEISANLNVSEPRFPYESRAIGTGNEELLRASAYYFHAMIFPFFSGVVEHRIQSGNKFSTWVQACDMTHGSCPDTTKHENSVEKRVKMLPVGLFGFAQK